MPRDFDAERCLWKAYSVNTLRSSVASARPGRLVRVGPTPLPGIESGMLAIELGPRNNLFQSRLWVCSESSWQRGASASPLVRLCHQGPAARRHHDALSYWIDPSDSFAQVSGLGAEWLLPTEEMTSSGYVLARLNTLMLDLETVTALGLGLTGGQSC